MGCLVLCCRVLPCFLGLGQEAEAGGVSRNPEPLAVDAAGMIRAMVAKWEPKGHILTPHELSVAYGLSVGQSCL